MLDDTKAKVNQGIQSHEVTIHPRQATRAIMKKNEKSVVGRELFFEYIHGVLHSALFPFSSLAP